MKYNFAVKAPISGDDYEVVKMMKALENGAKVKWGKFGEIKGFVSHSRGLLECNHFHMLVKAPMFAYLKDKKKFQHVAFIQKGWPKGYLRR